MKLRKKINITSLFIILSVLFFLWWINNFTLSVNEYTVESDKLSDEITIVHLSDLHGATFGKDNRTLVKRVTACAPDLIAVTGDMFTNNLQNGEESALVLIKTLAEKYPVYYVNGEHDNDDVFFEKLETAGVNVINYKDEIITVKSTRLHLYGIDNVYFTPEFDLNNAFEKDEENYSILLSHMAEKYQNFDSFGIDLTLSGDTHGGMFRLPFIGAIYDGVDILPDMSGKLMKGLYEYNDSFVHVSGGLGNFPLPLRFWNRPEIAVIKLSPTE